MRNTLVAALGAAVLSLTTVGETKGTGVVVAVPPSYRGLVLIEYPVPSCPYPEERQGRRIIPVSNQGRGCSRNGPEVDYDYGDNGPVRVAFSNAINKLLPYAPDSYVKDIYDEQATAAGVPGLPPRLTKGPMDTVTVFVWGRMAGGLCEDLKRQMMISWIGTVSDYKKVGIGNPEHCAPTPWP